MKNIICIDGPVTYMRLTQGQVACFDTADLPLVRGYTWCANRVGGKWYAITSAPKKVRMHQLLLTGVNRVDHIDGDGLNNRRKNLRRSNAQFNAVNAGKANVRATSRFKGVAFRKGAKKRPWRAYGVYNGKQVFLGNHATEREAADAYDAWAEATFDGHARLNRELASTY